MANNQNVELHDEDDDIVEGTHNMKTAEAQSVDSVDKTDSGISQAPTRRADKRGTGEVKAPSVGPKTKAGKIGAMYDKIKLLKKEDLDALYDNLMSEDFDLNDEETAREEVSVEVDFSEDLDALCNSEATLSEDFKANAATIFESAVNNKVAIEVNRLEEDYQTRIDEETTAMREELVEAVDSYLNYTVEQWLEQNELAIENGLRTEIAEGFMEKLHGLFEESYISVPESKVDLVDELADQVAELEESLNKATGDAIMMTEELEEFRRDKVIRENAEGLAATQVEKLASLVEGVEFEDEESFSAKVKTIKESYFNKKATAATPGDSLNESVESDEVSQQLDENSSMSRYVSAIRKTSQK